MVNVMQKMIPESKNNANTIIIISLPLLELYYSLDGVTDLLAEATQFINDCELIYEL